MLVRRRDLDKSEVQGQYLALEEPGNLAEEDGGEVGQTGLHRAPHIVADEDSVVAKTARVFWQHIGRFAKVEHMYNLHILQFRRAGHQRIHQRLGHTRAPAQIDPIARTYFLHRARGVGHLFSKNVRPSHCADPLSLTISLPRAAAIVGWSNRPSRVLTPRRNSAQPSSAPSSPRSPMRRR